MEGTSVPRDHHCHSASLVIPKGDHHDRIFYPILTLMIDSNIICTYFVMPENVTIIDHGQVHGIRGRSRLSGMCVNNGGGVLFINVI